MKKIVKNTEKKIALLIGICLLLLLSNVNIKALSSVTVNSEAELVAAISNNEDLEIVIGSPLVLTPPTTGVKYLDVVGNKTIVGNTTIEMSKNTFRVPLNASLTLGSTQNTTDNLQLNSAAGIITANGAVTLNDGVSLTSSTTMSMINIEGEGSSFLGTGGSIVMTADDSNALILGENSRATITGGTYTSEEEAIRISGGTVDLISGGTFTATNALNQNNPEDHRAALYVQQAWHTDGYYGPGSIKEISGGRFESQNGGTGVLVIWGGTIEKISGGTFIGTKDSASNHYGDGLSVASEGSSRADEYVYEISGGNFTGRMGVWNYGNATEPDVANINIISGGTFTGLNGPGFQNDLYGTVTEISGGNFIGTNYGVLNVNGIDTISGGNFTGKSGGFVNWATSASIYGSIKEISGGNFTSSNGSGFRNFGVIDLISQGTFVGFTSAIDSSRGMNEYPPALVTKITDGVFIGQYDKCIILQHPLILEPDLVNEQPQKGNGRYMGNNGVIFNDESLVIYPDQYFMSTATETSPLSASGVKYLTIDGATLYYDANIDNETVAQQAEFIRAGEQGTILNNMFQRTGYTFVHWNTMADDTGQVYMAGDLISLDDDMILYAIWQKDETTAPPIPEKPVTPAKPEPKATKGETAHHFVHTFDDKAKESHITAAGNKSLVLAALAGFCGTLVVLINKKIVKR